MATLLASKVARVRRHVGDHPDCAGFTDRDWRHLIHACDESTRRAIRLVKAGQAKSLLADHLMATVKRIDFDNSGVMESQPEVFIEMVRAALNS